VTAQGRWHEDPPGRSAVRDGRPPLGLCRQQARAAAGRRSYLPARGLPGREAPGSRAAATPTHPRHRAAEAGVTAIRFFPPRHERILHIKTDLANFREGPGTKAKILRVLRKGTPVIVLEEKDQWFRVRLDDGREGWIAESVAAE
jgi:hypothetical protein